MDLNAQMGLDTDLAAFPGQIEKFKKVQEILDRNRILIEEINANQEARTADSLQRNVVLIRELNSNVMRVVDIYRELSAFFLDQQNLGAAAEMEAAAGAAAQMTLPRPDGPPEGGTAP